MNYFILNKIHEYISADYYSEDLYNIYASNKYYNSIVLNLINFKISIFAFKATFKLNSLCDYIYSYYVCDLLDKHYKLKQWNSYTTYQDLFKSLNCEEFIDILTLERLSPYNIVQNSLSDQFILATSRDYLNSLVEFFKLLEYDYSFHFNTYNLDDINPIDRLFTLFRFMVKSGHANLAHERILSLSDQFNRNECKRTIFKNLVEMEQYQIAMRIAIELADLKTGVKRVAKIHLFTLVNIFCSDENLDIEKAFECLSKIDYYREFDLSADYWTNCIVKHFENVNNKSPEEFKDYIKKKADPLKNDRKFDQILVYKLLNKMISSVEIESAYIDSVLKLLKSNDMINDINLVICKRNVKLEDYSKLDQMWDNLKTKSRKDSVIEMMFSNKEISEINFDFQNENLKFFIQKKLKSITQ